MLITETQNQPTTINRIVKSARHDATSLRSTIAVAERLRSGEETVPTDAVKLQRNRAMEAPARAALSKSSYFSIRHVSCDVCDDRLVLRGRVPSFYMKQITQTVVRHLFEGVTIDNQLEVDRT